MITLQDATKVRLFKHFKTDTVYVLLGRAVHTETGEQLVLYREFTDLSARIWARPKSMFFENVDHGGANQPRFKELTLDEYRSLSAE
jgi:hypothetical protein